MKIVFASLLVFFASSSFAQSYLYVTDEFEVTMRSGQGSEHKILKTIATGTKLELVEEDSEAGYVLVRSESGTEGWVLSRYLVKQPVAKDRLVFAQAEIKKLENRLKEEKQQRSELENQRNSLQQQLDKLQKTHETGQNELAEIKRVSSDTVSLYEENTTLKADALNLQREIHALKQDNLALGDQSGQRWFMIGAALLIGGVLVGLIGPRMSRRKSWGGL